MLEFVADRQIYTKVILGGVFKAKRFVWIATATLKDMYVDKGHRKVPFLEVLSDLAGKCVEIRLLHSSEPGPAFQKDFDRYPALLKGMERVVCPRVHLKSIVVDGEFAYCGSGNLTGAGVGAKSEHKRNFEAGIITDGEKIVGEIMEQFDGIWRGAHCKGCKRKEYCSDYKYILAQK